MSSNSVNSETLRSGFTRFAVVAAEIPAPPPPITMSRSVIRRSPPRDCVRVSHPGCAPPTGRRGRCPCRRAARRRVAPAPARGLGDRVAEHGADVLHHPWLRVGQVEAHDVRGAALAEAVAGVDGHAPREQRDHQLLRARPGARRRRARTRGRARDGPRARTPSTPRERLLEVGEVRADRRLRALEVGLVAQGGERAALRDRVRVQARERGLELQAAAHQRARARRGSRSARRPCRSSATPRTSRPPARRR